MPLEQEQQYFDELLPSLASSTNHFAVISERRLIGIYSTIEQAYSEAVKKVGLRDILVRKIGEEQAQVNIPALTLGLLSANNPHPTFE